MIFAEFILFIAIIKLFLHVDYLYNVINNLFGDSRFSKAATSIYCTLSISYNIISTDTCNMLCDIRNAHNEREREDLFELHYHFSFNT